MKYYLGVDCGGSKSMFILSDENGRILATYRTGSGSFFAHGAEGIRRLVEQGTAEVCRQAGISAQDAVFSDINDAEGLQRDLEMTRTLGFDGKTCVHPRQINTVNACFTPSEKEIRNAKRVLEALEEAARNHTGVCVLDGGMVDKPMELRARATLAKAAAAGIKVGGVKE